MAAQDGSARTSGKRSTAICVTSPRAIGYWSGSQYQRLPNVEISRRRSSACSRGPAGGTEPAGDTATVALGAGEPDGPVPDGPAALQPARRAAAITASRAGVRGALEAHRD